MLAIFGLGFLLAIAAAVDPEQSSVGDLNYKLLETRLDQLEQKLQNTSNEQRSLLQRILHRLDAIQQQTSQMSVIKSCYEATTTKVYQLRLPNRAPPMDVFCDMDVLDGGWLVIQHRFDGSVDFNRSWAEYRDGFGEVGPSSEFWLGLEAIRQLTKGGDYELLVQLKNESGHDGQVRYERFQVAGEDRYTLSLMGGYLSGTVEEVLRSANGNEAFSTYDEDNDKWRSGSCAQTFGGGWWFYECKHTNLNGPFKKDSNTGRGMYWKGWTDAATYSRMLIRRNPLV